MICVQCNTGETTPVTTIANFEQQGAMVVIKGVPAEICDECGAIYLQDYTALQLMVQMEAAIEEGVEIREYQTAV